MRYNSPGPYSLLQHLLGARDTLAPPSCTRLLPVAVLAGAVSMSNLTCQPKCPLIVAKEIPSAPPVLYDKTCHDSLACLITIPISSIRHARVRSNGTACWGGPPLHPGPCFLQGTPSITWRAASFPKHPFAASSPRASPRCPQGLCRMPQQHSRCTLRCTFSQKPCTVTMP